MATYRYEVKSAMGRITAGLMTAQNLNAAALQLRSRGEYILLLAPADGPASARSFNINISFGPSAKDVRNFTSQLAVMIRAGISIRSAIEGIAEQATNPKFKTM